MQFNWIITSAISGLVGGIIAWFLTGNWTIALVCAIIVFVIVVLNNPNRRYIRAFYIVLFPLLSNIYFTIQSKTENFDIQAGLKELDMVTTFVLGLIAVSCLFLDYLERNGKLKGTMFSFKKNQVGDIKGHNNQINQTNV